MEAGEDTSVLGIDGQPHKLQNVAVHTAKVYRISIGLSGKKPSRAFPEPERKHWSDLRVTGSQRLMLRLEPQPFLHEEMLELTRLEVRIGDAFGGLPRPIIPISQHGTTVAYDSFAEAFFDGPFLANRQHPKPGC